MSFAMVTNFVTIILCLAVLIQSVRMMRSLDRVKSSHLKGLVDALEVATGHARSVLADLKRELSTEGAANVRALSEGKDIRDELNLIVGIASAMADRLVDAGKIDNSLKTDAKPEAGKDTLKKSSTTTSRKRPPSKAKASGVSTRKPRTAAKEPNAKASDGAAKTSRPKAAASPKTPGAPRKPRAKRAATVVEPKTDSKTQAARKNAPSNDQVETAAPAGVAS